MKITWKNLLRLFSFDEEIKRRLDILNELDNKRGLKTNYINFGTASMRRKMEENGEMDKILSQLDQEIIRRSQNIDRTIIKPTPTMVG